VNTTITSEQSFGAPIMVPPRPAGRMRPAQMRWSIWAEQRRAGHEPCFGTDNRIVCEEVGCPWRGECLALRAEWRR